MGLVGEFRASSPPPQKKLTNHAIWRVLKYYENFASLNPIYYKISLGQHKEWYYSCTFAMCVQERAPLENNKNCAIWHVWSTYAKFPLK